MADGALKGDTRKAAFVLDRYCRVENDATDVIEVDPRDEELLNSFYRRVAAVTRSKEGQKMSGTAPQKVLNALLRKDFVLFVEKCFAELNPGVEFLPNWHIEAIATDLECVRTRVFGLHPVRLTAA